MKKAFSLLEVLVSIFLLSILVGTSIKAYSHLKEISLRDTLRYLALDKIDNEMSRLIYAYEDDSMNNFREFNYSFNDALRESFQIKPTTIAPTGLNENSTYNVYKKNPINSGDFGLLVDTSATNSLNIVELKNNSGIVNSVDEGDIVALLGFRTQDYTDTVQNRAFADISLSLTYPYVVKDGNYVQLWNDVETVNLKTVKERKKTN